MLTENQGQFSELAQAILEGARFIGGPEVEKLFRENHRFVGVALSVPGTVSFWGGRKLMDEDKNNLTPPS